MSDESEVKLFVSAILRFLKGQLETRTLTSDAAESLEVSIQCLENAYNLENTDAVASGSDGDNPLKHVDLFELFTNSCLNVNPEKKSAAEALKNEGNHLMKLEKYQEALIYYNRAINMDATNPVFYCNRAAAYSKLGELQKSIDDCKMSLRYDPNYGKAYGRLGLAYSKLNRYEDSIEAYQNALRIEPNNIDYQNNLSVTQERLNEARQVGGISQNPLGALNMNLAGAVPGAGGEVGGLPLNIDFEAALNNPTLINLASRMMSEPGIQDLLGQLSRMNNMDALLETGRQMTERMTRENPELISTFRQQFEQFNQGNPGEPINQANSEDAGITNPQQPPSMGDNEGGTASDPAPKKEGEN